MTAKMPDPTQWFAELITAQQTMWGLAATPPDGEAAPAVPAMPWLQAAGAVAQ